MTKYESNKEKLPNLDSFENAENSILRDMWRNAKKYHLSDKQVNFANRLWDEEKNGSQAYADNLIELPMLDKFKDARSEILRDFWWKAKKWKLSDKQLTFARKLWSAEQMPMIELSQEMVDFLTDAAEKYLPNNYYTSTGSYVAGKIYTRMEQSDYDTVLAKFEKYKKSVLNKVFI